MPKQGETRAQALANKLLASMHVHKPGPALAHALNGSLDSYIATEVVKELAGKESCTFGDIRRATNKVLGGDK